MKISARFLLFFLSIILSWAVVSMSSASVSGQHVQRRHLLSQSNHLNLIRRSIPLWTNRTLTVCVIVREPFVIYNGGVRQSSQVSGSETNEPAVDSAQRHQQQNEDQAYSDMDNYSGVVIEILRRLSVIFGFNIRMMRPKDNQFGVLQPDRGWSGLMGSLVRHECDIGATALSITVTRANWVDFTRAYYVETGTILLRIPSEVQNYSAIFEPFSLTVWIVLMATILLLIALITVMTKLEEKQREQHRLFKLAKLLATRQTTTQSSSSASATSSAKTATRSTAIDGATNEDKYYLHQLEGRLAAVEEARHRQEFGSTWPERFYYATSCVLNILLIRGEYLQHPIVVVILLWTDSAEQLPTKSTSKLPQ